MELMDAGRVPGLKGMIMTIFGLITHVSLAASQRNMSVNLNTTSGSVGGFYIGNGDYYLWNSRMKTEEKCLRFRPAETPSFYFMWPEPQFRYCCGLYGPDATNVRATSLLSRYVYHQYGPKFQTGRYQDLATIESCMPYWRCWNSHAINGERTLQYYYLYCEAGDLKRLYTKRFWSLAVGKCGILMSALPLIAILEVGILLATIALRMCRLATSPWKEIFILWWRILFWMKFRTWLHLTLLTIVGNCFMEAIGHQDPYTWESIVMDNFTKLYLILPICLLISAFIQQVVDWRVMDKCIMKANQRTREGEECMPEDIITERPQLRAELVNMDDDWRWQPIFMQIATLSVLGFYIRYASDDARTEFVSLLLGLAAVATTWSALVIVIVFFRKLDLFRKSFRHDFLADPPSEQRMRTDPGSKHHRLASKV